MSKLFSKTAALAALLSLGCLGLWGQAAPEGQAQPQWKDRAEWELVQEIEKQTDLNKKVALLDSWQQKYPESSFKLSRQLLYLDSYLKLDQAEKAYQAARSVLESDPNHAIALNYVVALTDNLKSTAPDRLAFGEKAANQLLSQVDAILANVNIPADQKAAEKTRMQVQAHRTLMFIYSARQNNAGMEREITEILKLAPNNGALSFELGRVMVAQKVPEKQIPAFYHFARGVGYSGEGELPAQAKTQARDYLRKIYTSFHGSEQGLSELIQLAQKSPLPPPGFTIKSAQQLAVEEENRIKRENPQLATWLFGFKRPLQEQGAGYFDAMKGSAVGPFKGKVVSAFPANQPKEIFIAIEKEGVAEIKLVMEEPLANNAEPGTELEFRGVATGFAANPFMLTLELDLEVEGIVFSGWPQAAGRGRGATKSKSK